MKKLFTKIRPYISFSRRGLFSALLFVGILFTAPANAYYDDGAAEGAFFGGVTGAAIGGAAGGGKGAAIGGAAGFGLGGIMGSAASRDRDPDYKLDRLYRKRDRIQRKLRQATSDKRINRYKEQLAQVDYDIRKYEQVR